MKKVIIAILFLNLLCLSSFSTDWEGEGTIDAPYLVSTPQQLVALAEDVNNGTEYLDIVFSLANDIDLSEICGDSIGSWIPIGNSYYYFEGSFCGNNHKISNLYINSKDNYQGLFAYVGQKGTIKDLIVENGYVHGNYWTSGIVASNFGIVSNCKNTQCTIDGRQFAGGVCGVNFNLVDSCSNTADVNCQVGSGGICAYNYGTLKNSSNYGAITATEGCGGVCGYNGGFANANCYESKVGFVDNCENFASIVGYNKIGGVAGRNDGFIVNAMNDGEINGSKFVGGITGCNGGLDGVTGNVSNSFNVASVYGRESSTGGVIGYGNEASEIFNSYSGTDVHCVSSPTPDFVGENEGLKDNCFALLQLKEKKATLDSIVGLMNEWITTQSDSGAYLKWDVKGRMIYHLTREPDSLPDDLWADTLLVDSLLSDSLLPDSLLPDTLKPEITDTLLPDTLKPEIMDTLLPDTLKPEITDTLLPDTLKPEITDTLLPDTLKPEITDTLLPDTLKPEITDTLLPDTLKPEITDTLLPDTLKPEITDTLLPDTLKPEISNKNDSINMIDSSIVVKNVTGLENVRIFSSKAKFYIISPVDQTVSVYSSDGRFVRYVDLYSNTMIMIPMKRGVYMVNRRKVLVY